MSSEKSVVDEGGSGSDGTDDTVDVAAELERLRAENAELKAKLPADTAAAPAPSKGYRRRWLSITCAVFGALFLIMSVVTVWMRNTLLDTENYVETVAPLAENADIQEAVTFRVTEAVAEAADFESLAEEALSSESLPEQASLLAVPIASGAESLISDIVGEVVSSDQFARVWEDANKIAHENVVFVLTGESTDVIETEDGTVVLQLGALARDVLDRLGEQLNTDLFDNIPAEDLDAEVTLVQSEELADAQGAVQFFDNLSWLAPILAILLLAGTVFFAEDRRLGVRRLGLAVVIPIVLALLAYSWGREEYLSALPSDVHNPDAAAAAFDILTRFLVRALRALLVFGVLALIGAWVVGPTKLAARVRSWWDALLGRAGDAGEDREVGPVPVWVAANERSLDIGVAVVAGLALVLWTKPTGLVVLLLAVAAGLLIGIIRVVSEVARRAGDDSDAGDSGEADRNAEDQDTETDSGSSGAGDGDDGADDDAAVEAATADKASPAPT